MKNANKINDLINSLIKSFKEYDTSLKNKIRVNSIFSNLDENTSKNFGKLINLSELRYKSVKSGVKLNNILKTQKPRYENLIEELKNDKLYSTNSLEKEKDKLFKSSVIYKNKEILEIRNKLKDSLKPKQNNFTVKNKSNPSSKEKLPKLRNIIKKVSNLAHLNEFLKNKIENKRLSKQNELLTDTLLQEDYQNFHDKMCSYQNFLSKIRNMSENNSTKKRLKIDKTIFKDTIDSINPNSFRALTYKESSNKKTHNIKKKDLEFDLHKIKNIKMSHDKNYNTILKNKHSKIGLTEYNNTTGTNISLKHKSFTSQNLTNYSINNSLNSKTILNINKNKKNKFLDMKKLNDLKNTAYIVLNETENGIFNEEIFKTKRNKLKNHYKYFKTFNSINDKQIQSQNRRSIKSLKNEEYEDKNNQKQRESIFEIKDYKEKNNELIRKNFQEIYEQKKLKWKKEDKLYELKKERDKQNKHEIENFLFEIQDKNILKRQKYK